MNYGQVKDNQGNTIRASKDMRMLYDAGWRIVKIKRMGMVKQIWWYDLKTKESKVMQQQEAVLLQRSRNKEK